jgi:chemotaxis protein methyltransferase CheR
MRTLEEIAELVHHESGILIREAQYDALAAAVKRIDPAGDPAGFVHRVTDLVAGPALLARLLDEVTVKETFFLRHAAQLEQIPWQQLLDRARRRGAETVRVWSAACATGEEAYGLALLAYEAFGPVEPPVTILATDISEGALARARAGAYRAYSTRELSPELRLRYFREDGDRLVVGKRLRSLVTFGRHNLVRDPLPPLGEAAFDLILCRNVLIYFDSDTVDGVVAALGGALVPDGKLVLGAADALCRGAGHLRALATAVTPLAQSAPPRQSTLLRRPLGRLGGRPAADDPVGVADAAGAGKSDEVISRTRRLLATDPLNASAHFLHGLAELEAGDADAAIAALRKALFAEPQFGLAAFQLGRAYEALGNRAAARRAYEQSLRTCDPDGELHEPLLGQVDLSDVVAAARTRLDALTAIGTGTR